jgi:hypothetical protein
MSLLLSLLVTNAFFHGLVVARFGVKHHNQPFFIFAIIDAALAIAVYFSVLYALWAVLLLSIFGLVGLSVTFNKPVRARRLTGLFGCLMRPPFCALPTSCLWHRVHRMMSRHPLA